MSSSSGIYIYARGCNVSRQETGSDKFEKEPAYARCKQICKQNAISVRITALYFMEHEFADRKSQCRCRMYVDMFITRKFSNYFVDEVFYHGKITAYC